LGLEDDEAWRKDPQYHYHGEEPELSPPADLANQYRFGVQPEELEHLDPKLKQLLSFANATQKEIHHQRRLNNTKNWGTRPYDTGTPGVMMANLTVRLNALKFHLNTNSRDIKNRRKLDLLVNRRQKLLRYIRKKDVPLYYQLVDRLGIKDLDTVKDREEELKEMVATDQEKKRDEKREAKRAEKKDKAEKAEKAEKASKAKKKAEKKGEKAEKVAKEEKKDTKEVKGIKGGKEKTVKEAKKKNKVQQEVDDDFDEDEPKVKQKASKKKKTARNKA